MIIPNKVTPRNVGQPPVGNGYQNKSRLKRLKPSNSVPHRGDQRQYKILSLSISG